MPTTPLPFGRTIRVIPAVLIALAAIGLGGCEDPTIFSRNSGLRAYELGNVDDAQSDFEQCLKDNPSDWKSMWYLAKIRIHQGKSAEAHAMLERVLVLRSGWPETPDILDDLAEAIYRENDPSALASMLQNAIQQYGAIRDFQRQAKYLGLIGDVDGAKLAYTKVIRFTGPKQASGYIALANYLESVGDIQDAIIALRKASFIEPQNYKVADRLRKYGVVPGPAAAIEPDPDEFKPTYENSQPKEVPPPPAPDTQPRSKALFGRENF